MIDSQRGGELSNHVLKLVNTEVEREVVVKEIVDKLKLIDRRFDFFRQIWQSPSHRSRSVASRSL